MAEVFENVSTKVKTRLGSGIDFKNCTTTPILVFESIVDKMNWSERMKLMNIKVVWVLLKISK